MGVAMGSHLIQNLTLFNSFCVSIGAPCTTIPDPIMPHTRNIWGCCLVRPDLIDFLLLGQNLKKIDPGGRGKKY